MPGFFPFHGLTSEPASAFPWVTDHGQLEDLGEDDHPQYLLADGSRALSEDWDAGDFLIRALQFQSSETSDPPFIVESSALVSNLNADLLGGNHDTHYLNASRFTSGNLAWPRLPSGTGTWSDTLIQILGDLSQIGDTDGAVTVGGLVQVGSGTLGADTHSVPNLSTIYPVAAPIMELKSSPGTRLTEAASSVPNGTIVRFENSSTSDTIHLAGGSGSVRKFQAPGSATGVDLPPGAWAVGVYFASGNSSGVYVVAEG